MPDLVHAVQQELRLWTWLDWLIAFVVGASTCAAVARGLIRSLLSLVALCLGIAAATLYSLRLAPVLLAWCGSPVLARTLSFVLLLLAIYIFFSLLGRVLKGVCHAVGLGMFDRLAGAVFGFIRGNLLLAALLLPLTPYLQHSVQFRSSVLLPYLLRVSHGVCSVMPRRTGKIYSQLCG